MNFKLKQTLISIAVVSLFAPFASHAQNAKGQWIFDGFGRATKDGNGSKCVSSGGADHAFQSDDCDQAAGVLAKRSTDTTPMTQAESAAEAPSTTAATAEPATTTAAPTATAPTAAAPAVAAAPAATMTAAAGDMRDVVTDPSRNGIVRDANGTIVRDGVNRYCVWDNRWTPAVSGENCEGKAMAAEAPAAVAATEEPAEVQPAAPEQELAKRVDMPPPEVDKSGLAAAPAETAPAENIADAAPAEQAKPAEAAAADNLTDRSPGEVPAAVAKADEPAAIVDNNVPEFPVTKYQVEDDNPPTTALADTSPGVAPPPEEKKETPAVVDNEPAKFPENKYTVEETAAPPKEEVAAAAPPKEQVAAAAPPKTVLATFQMEKAKLFKFNSAKLRKSGLAQIDALVDTLNGANDYGTVTVVGHTDRIGSDKYNQRLSERRANAVRSYLVAKGVSPDKIVAEGRGKADPVTANADCEGMKGKKLRACLAPDRRVVVEAAGTLPSTEKN